MDEKEMKELFAMLEKQGMKPELCDIEIPFFDAKVPCGNPTVCYDDDEEYVRVPKSFLSLQREFITTITGESMCDVGLKEGDRVWIQCGTAVNDGDVVLASIDGEVTIKGYFKDKNGRRWLLPKSTNKKFKPIRLDGQANITIWGRVKERLDPTLRMSYAECEEIVRLATEAESMPNVISDDMVNVALRGIAEKVKSGRQWYAVFRKLVDRKVYGKNDIEPFCKRVCDLLPNHEHLPTTRELQRMAVQSFAKPVPLWNENNAPVKGKYYRDYVGIALRMDVLLGVSD